jgi:Xaa-Pro aminopeptidase
VTAALVPPRFPVFVADHLRANGIELTVDGETFVARRRRKSPAQLEGIRRAQAAADAAMGVAARMVAELRSAEEIRAAMRAACDEHDVELRADDALVAHGAQAAVVHDLGSGPLVAGEPVVIDFCPQDRRSRCWTDMTRTFVAGGGEAPEELRRFWELARRALEDVRGAVRAGASGRELWQRSCAPFDEAGIPTLRTAPDGVPLAEGYYHGLGHGVGLEVHERPNLGRVDDTLMAGDVIAVEPGCYRPGFGGARLEDLLVVTEDGCETVTSFPYDLAP